MNWKVTVTDGSTSFGGPGFENTAPQLTNGAYSYIQYEQPETGNCHLIFTQSENGENKIIADIDASKINSRIGKVVDTVPDWGVLICSPLEWGDVNKNGKPDLPIAFNWANQYTGSELHIFEVTDDSKITNLTQSLPGIMSPWEFNPQRTDQMVIDLQWANHDCIYPPMWVYWVYDWSDGKYVDITPELDFSEGIYQLVDDLESGFGKPLNFYGQIEQLALVLLVYEKIGERDTGWKEYERLANEKNWPGTSGINLEWLRSDVAHFKKEYLSGKPFTPNDYCDLFK
jgi:hypothetical protein